MLARSAQYSIHPRRLRSLSTLDSATSSSPATPTHVLRPLKLPIQHKHLSLKFATSFAAYLRKASALVFPRSSSFQQQVTDFNKKTVVVLGTGWGAVSFLRSLDTSEYQTIVVSPRNYFLFTPLLPSVTTGSLESRSIIAPLKHFLRSKSYSAKFVEAEAHAINTDTKTVTVVANGEMKGQVTKVDIPYDYLVVSVGAESNTFGIKGVREHGFFLKEIIDARRVRRRIMDCIETAAFPNQPVDEVKRLLHFVVVGGGPTGVEYAGELHDFLKGEVRKWYPEIAEDVKVTLIEALPHVLPMFSREMIDYSEASFKNMNIDILTNTRVKEVHEKELLVVDQKGQQITVPYGMLVWATGNTLRPLVKDLMANLKAQVNRNGLLVDDYLRLVGANNIWSLGDCTATKFAGTAQVASQQGAYLAHQFNNMALVESKTVDTEKLPPYPPFDYKHRAMLAYIGDERGVSDVILPFFGKSFSFAGYQSYLFWRSAYLSGLFTVRNKTLVAFDWTKEKLFGRDISRE